MIQLLAEIDIKEFFATLGVVLFLGKIFDLSVELRRYIKDRSQK